MTPEQQAHFNATFAQVVQPQQSDPRPVFEYEDYTQVPLPLTRPLTRADVADLIGTAAPATFTVKVPLHVVVGAMGDESISEFISRIAFDEPLRLTSCEYRAVGSSFGEFDGQYEGLVHLQVTCAIYEE